MLQLFQTTLEFLINFNFSFTQLEPSLGILYAWWWQGDKGLEHVVRLWSWRDLGENFWFVFPLSLICPEYLGRELQVSIGEDQKLPGRRLIPEHS